MNFSKETAVLENNSHIKEIMKNNTNTLFPIFMRYCKLFLFLLFFVTLQSVKAQTPTPNDTVYNFEIDYGTPKQYTIAGIEVVGADNYEDFTLIGFSGLSVGQSITIPGEQITDVTKKFWQQSLFSEVKIYPKKAVGDKIWLVIQLKARPKV